MSYKVKNPNTWEGKDLIGNRHCVGLVQGVSSIPKTSHWKRGAKVKSNSTIVEGTIIATFSDAGVYENAINGDSHAAIYLSQNGTGITVIDQWEKLYKIGKRVIKYNGGKGLKCNDGDQYYIVD